MGGGDVDRSQHGLGKRKRRTNVNRILPKNLLTHP